METAPELPEGYSWQFINRSGQGFPQGFDLYAVQDAVEARLWCENGELVALVNRSSPDESWCGQIDPGPTKVFGSLAALVDEARSLDMLTTEEEECS
jgi:hypothetical protein